MAASSNDPTLTTMTGTITFGDRAENNVGMEIRGEAAPAGFSPEELIQFAKNFSALGYNYEYYPMECADEKAALLVIRKGVGAFGVSEESIRKEFFEMPYDKQFYNSRRKMVQNKHARYNACIDEQDQAPDIASGKGTVVSRYRLPGINQIMSNLHVAFGEKARNLKGETNLYYDIKRCYIS